MGSKNRDNNLVNILLTSWIPIILSGVVLSGLNYYYWKKQEAYKKKELYIQEKLKAYASVSESTTKLLTHLNQIYKTNEQLKHISNRNLLERANKLDSEIPSILMSIGNKFSICKIYFSEKAANKMEDFNKTLITWHYEKISPDSDIYKKAKELAQQLSSEVRQEFDNGSMSK
jgi:flagellar basal body-associated protein FliL